MPSVPRIPERLVFCRSHFTPCKILSSLHVAKTRNLWYLGYAFSALNSPEASFRANLTDIISSIGVVGSPANPPVAWHLSPSPPKDQDLVYEMTSKPGESDIFILREFSVFEITLKISYLSWLTTIHVWVSWPKVYSVSYDFMVPFLICVYIKCENNYCWSTKLLWCSEGAVINK